MTSGVEIRIGTHKSKTEFGLILRPQKKELESLETKKSRLKRKKLLPKRRLPSSRRQQEIEWVDLDKYIELLLDSKSEDEIVFIYCNPNENGDPYDLEVCSYDDRNEDKYYTLSGKSLSVHEGDHLTDFISLAQWLLNRDSYNHFKE